MNVYLIFMAPCNNQSFSSKFTSINLALNGKRLCFFFLYLFFLAGVCMETELFLFIIRLKLSWTHL